MRSRLPMLRHRQRTRNRGRGRDRHKPDTLTVAWANVGKQQASHIIILELCFSEHIDVVCVQEPITYQNTTTQNHPGYDLFAPVPVWGIGDEREREAQRPRVLTYVRKGKDMITEQRQSISRDLLWVVVNNRPILNVYRQPTTHEVIDYVKNLVPPNNCLVGGDFNVGHGMFDPGVTPSRSGPTIAQWASESGMDFIGDPGVATHRLGNVLDLTFSNLPFAKTIVRDDLHSTSDHKTQVTTIRGRGRVPLEQVHHRVPESALPTFAALVHTGVARLPDPRTLTTPEQIDTFATHFAAVMDSAIQTAGKKDTGQGHGAHWWTAECKAAHRAYKRSNTANEPVVSQECRDFKTAVVRAKQDYWRNRIDGCETDRDLYLLVGWHKLTTNLKSPPLEVNGRLIEGSKEKAEALYTEVLQRFDAADDLPEDPLAEDDDRRQTLPWDQTTSLEEVERFTIGVSSTSPGVDRVTVRLLKACWAHIKHIVHGIFDKCLALSHFPQPWKLAEVAMMPKVGKQKQMHSVRSWRPIALLSCVSKGLERIIAKRLAWTALTHGILSPQHGGALPKRSGMDLVASFTHDVERALSAGKEITMITMDVQGAFDALLARRLLKRMIAQGWPKPLLQLVQGFLSDRKVRVRLEKATTQFYDVKCGTPQGSPLSPVLYMLYLAELFAQDQELRFGYADDICLYRVSNSLDTNVQLLSEDVRSILRWGDDNKVFFAPEKQEMIHITKKRHDHAPPCVINDEISIEPITTAERRGDQPALRWLGVWFDRKLTFKRHVSERVTKARKVAFHIRGLAKTTRGPPAHSLRKAVVTCVLPSALYGAEAWYGGRKKIVQNREVSTRMGWHLDTVERTITLAARGVLPVWKTTPNITLLRDAGLPSAEAALEEARLRFALRLQTVDEQHPLVRRMQPPMITRGRGTGSRQAAKTKVERAATCLASVPRPKLRPPHFSPGCRTDPTLGMKKKKAAEAFNKWWTELPPTDITIFSDGTERYQNGHKLVGYGYIAYRNRREIGSGCGAINTDSHVFDAEVIGVRTGLARTLRAQPPHRRGRIWLCIDSTSVIWCIRGNAASTSQWAFHEIQDIMQTHDIGVKWAPGHMGIVGNEAADKLATFGSSQPWDPGMPSEPTISGIKTQYRQMRDSARALWWENNRGSLSRNYKRWELEYRIVDPPELLLSRPILHRLLALRSTHGDFHWYHAKFKHVDANLKCSCGRRKAPLHIVRCRKSRKRFRHWPEKPDHPPSSDTEALTYLRDLSPDDFAKLLLVTEFYSSSCPR